ncbi:MAG TPA: PAS domain S-box protein, partial [Kofleriaceae bacterium]|nr:PAS domain S-box protein [Kofleriaceae bacterium]
MTKLPQGRHREASPQDDVRLLVDGLLDYGIVMLDVTGKILTWNAGARRMLGYAADEIVGDHYSVFYPEADRSAGKPASELAIARSEGRFEDEGWRVRKDGTAFWANVVISPLYDESGALRAFGKVTRDLTERRNAEARYRLLVDSVRDYAILTLDRRGIVQTWNLGAERIKGYTAAEIIGQDFRRFYTPVDLARDYPTTELERAAEVGRYEDEGWRVRKDGTTFWANVLITALRNPAGEVIGFSKVTRDLTERRRAEQSLRDSEERFRLMVASVKEYAIIMLDPGGIIISWNAGAERIKGWRADEIIGHSFERFYPPEDVAAGKTALELRVAAATGMFEDNGWRVRKDGTRFWANVIITALRDESGALRGFSKVTRDQTERKNADEALRKAYDDLEAFSYSVSHDLRAPLRSMDGFSHELTRRYADQLDDRGKDYLGRIRTSAQRMARLIDDLLNLSRLGRAKLTLAPIDLADLARKIAEELQRAEPDRVVEFVIAPTMKVRADAALMRVVLDNLIGNAWKYTSHHATARIEVGVTTLGGAPAFFVRDDGAGFDMQHGSKLFGAFQRLHATEKFPGTGIG